MSDLDRVAHARHELANPLTALLTEAHLLLTGNTPLDEDTRRGLQEIEALALRMREIVRELK